MTHIVASACPTAELPNRQVDALPIRCESHALLKARVRSLLGPLLLGRHRRNLQHERRARRGKDAVCTPVRGVQQPRANMPNKTAILDSHITPRLARGAYTKQLKCLHRWRANRKTKREQKTCAQQIARPSRTTQPVHQAGSPTQPRPAPAAAVTSQQQTHLARPGPEGRKA